MCGCSYAQNNDEVFYQTSTINALLDEVYDGNITVKELKGYGDLGLGTYNNLDGEMIGLDGLFYQVKADGIAYAVDDSIKTPFAVVTFFESDKTIVLEKSVNYKQLEQYLDNVLPTRNIFYAFKIEGTFKYIKTRSVPWQDKPYPPLVEIVKDQPIFEFHDVNGTIVGSWFPGYMKGINVPGYHFHFITEDKKGGGHLLECQTGGVKIGIDYTSNSYLALPEDDEFYKAELSKENQDELKKVEK
ncbi:alpha-acetolactate decarboxylase [Candidatus Scalindua japonica]|uniref:Alpha-acetolactate decarboxylase n=2 Tax=Candidatus Scalindua japonica TaxID=1284222 RepID=A0A286U373_9BACT|nr:alpha-acetolactate decarboxylase [Candidatus Scalindua japonica]